MKKTYTLLIVAALTAIPLYAGITHEARPDATAAPPIGRTAHLLTVKNTFGWADALEIDLARPGDGKDTVSVDVTNCHGVGPIPAPLAVNVGQSKTWEGGLGFGFNGSQCNTTGSFDVVDLGIKDGDANVSTRAVYSYAASVNNKSVTIRDVLKIPDLPDMLTYPTCATCSQAYEFSGVWNGIDGRSSFIAFINKGPEGNVRMTITDDTTGSETSETVYLHGGDVFYEMTTRINYGRIRMTIPPLGTNGINEISTPKIYAVLFRGFKGAGVAEAIVPRRTSSGP